MQESELSQIKRAISKLKWQNRRLTWGFRILLLLWIATLSAFAVIKNTSAETSMAPDSVLRVRGLIVVDEKGTERVRIGAPLPDPLLLGKRLKRDGSISGILLMDGEGNERSGYFTSDEPGTVALTLDTVQGQTAQFLANDDYGANLQMRDQDHGHSVELYAVGNAPNLIITRAGKPLFQLPEEKEQKK